MTLTLPDTGVLSFGDLIDRATPEQLKVVKTILGEHLAVVDAKRAPTTFLGIEKELEEALSDKWDKTGKAAVDKGVKTLRDYEEGKITQARMDKVLADLEAAMGVKYGTSTLPDFRRAVLQTWRLSSKAEAQKAGVRWTTKLIDETAVKTLSENHTYWIGKFYGDSLSDGIRFATRKVIVEEGLAGKDAAARFRRVADSFLKGKGYTKFPEAPPPTWNGTPDDYFAGLGNHVGTQARVFGRIETFGRLDLKTYRIVAVLDRRTSRVCRLMHGQTFTVEQAQPTLDAWTSTDPETVKDKAGWMRIEDLTELAGLTYDKDTVLTSPKISSSGLADLASAGQALPPYHFRCRTDVVSA